MERCLASWKKYYFSQGGKLLYQKYFIWSTYFLHLKKIKENLSTFLSLFSNLVSVVCHIEKLQHNLLWGGMGEVFKFVSEPLQYWARSLKFWLLLSSNYIYFFDKQLYFYQAIIEKWLWLFAKRERSALEKGGE